MRTRSRTQLSTVVPLLACRQRRKQCLSSKRLVQTNLMAICFVRGCSWWPLDETLVLKGLEILKFQGLPFPPYIFETEAVHTSFGQQLVSFFIRRDHQLDWHFFAVFRGRA